MTIWPKRNCIHCHTAHFSYMSYVMILFGLNVVFSFSVCFVQKVKEDTFSPCRPLFNRNKVVHSLSWRWIKCWTWPLYGWKNSYERNHHTDYNLILLLLLLFIFGICQFSAYHAHTLWPISLSFRNLGMELLLKWVGA